MSRENDLPVAIVTGAAGGIGFATAMLLSMRGYRVVTCDLNPLSEPLPADSGWDQHLIADVSCVDDLLRLVNAASALGPIRALVNNAGVGLIKQVEDVSEAEWDRVLGTNFKSAFFATKHVLPYMKKAGGGSIVNVSSNAGLLPRAHDPVYSISKMALVGMTRSLALCLSCDNIRVNSVCPGPVSNTGMVDAELDRAEDREAAVKKVIAASPLASSQGRMITPEEVAESIAYLLSDASSMITGTAIAIDGGKSLGVPPADSWKSGLDS
ncbi:MAG: SDR family oxidoreductase [Planctomycetaceae bacterium]|nr:SDR family oxidoreductase [Planctomycetaceae bacterium]